ncbi:MAG TPA: hypothetical protein VGS04_05395, partial [Nitrososphaerales archaeon]|nr:hypothetical protein [Nitrososphaerales archaeon]
APSVYPDFAEYLVSIGIDSISVSPDSVARTKELVFRAESKRPGEGIPGGDDGKLAVGAGRGEAGA